MKSLSSHKLSYVNGLLSAFDINGSLFLSEPPYQPEEMNQDMHQLLTDLENLEQDYQRAYENINKDIFNE